MNTSANQIFEPRDPDFESKVRTSFELQKVMATLGIELSSVLPGEVELRMEYDDALTQQHGFIHAGITTTAMDRASAYAAFSLMPQNAAVLTVEFKTTLLAPAKGSEFHFCGQVLKPGKTLTYTEGYAWALDGADRVLVASMTATIMALHDRNDLQL